MFADLGGIGMSDILKMIDWEDLEYEFNVYATKERVKFFNDLKSYVEGLRSENAALRKVATLADHFHRRLLSAELEMLHIASKNNLRDLVGALREIEEDK